MDTLVGSIERITFQSSETGYTVAKLRPELRLCETTERLTTVASREGLFSIFGNLASLSAGERVKIDGYWMTHARYGRQFKIVEFKALQPSTVEGITKYLGSGLIKGIGPVRAKIIVDHFGTDTLDIIDRHPDRLSEVSGVALKTLDIIKKGWREQKHIQEVMQFLISHDVSTSFSVKIFKTYGDDAIEKVTENPYRLSSDIWGVGFKSADRIARNLGVAPNSPERIVAGIRYVLSRFTDDGHVYVPNAVLTKESQATLEVDAETIPVALSTLAAEDEVVIEGDRVYLTPYFHAERGISRHLKRLMASNRSTNHSQILESVEQIQREQGVQFNTRQREAIVATITGSVLVLTGGPGTGKTTCTRGMLSLLMLFDQRVLLTAPTGRAAKRLTEVAGSEAKTIHRLLEFGPDGGFKKGKDDPLDTDAVILDEVSMVDTVIMNALLRAIPSHARLIMVGDADQLPSVGAGNVLHDIVASDHIPVVHLNEIFRQASESDIVMNAHMINHGEIPSMFSRKEGDFFFIEEDDPSTVQSMVVDLCLRRLPARYRFDAIEDIQVLSPMYRGEVGVDQLNDALQEALNPNTEALKRGDREIRVGDKVLQTRNNYDKMVFNGDIGRVVGVDQESQTVNVLFSEIVAYEPTELDELVLAYAVSVHKSQGAEYPAVVLPLLTTHYMMLQRNLLYTAVTRARALVVIVGTRKALGIAINNDTVRDRFTGLRDRLVDDER
jgi:exodeoxyribonuclease V alpha subunit